MGYNETGSEIVFQVMIFILTKPEKEQLVHIQQCEVKLGEGECWEPRGLGRNLFFDKLILREDPFIVKKNGNRFVSDVRVTVSFFLEIFVPISLLKAIENMESF